jgi:DNA-binding CsgD family transcriptional regulator
MGRLDLRDVVRDEDLAQASTGPLTVIELEVLAGAARGESVAASAKRLHRSCGTVKHHRAAVLDKLGAKNMVEAVRLAYERGIFGKRPDRSGQLPINAEKRDAFHAKCSAIDKMRELEPRSTKKLMLEQASEEFARAITSANDFTQDEARLVLDLLDSILVGADVELGKGERLLAAAGASA